MRWEDERYVRLYTRNTGTWVSIGWEGRFVLMSLLRQVDRAGVLDVVSGEENEVLSAMLMAPLEVVTRGISRLVDRGTVVLEQGKLRMPRFLEAQECRTSDKERQRKSRELAAVCHTPSHAVTAGHTPSQIVTPSRAVPSRAVPKEALSAKKPADPRLKPLTEKLVHGFAIVRGENYKHGGAKDTLALKALLVLAPDDEIEIRWFRALELGTQWPGCSTFAQLAAKWNDLGAPSVAREDRYARPDPNGGIIRGAS